jgi:hypothetical protein
MSKARAAQIWAQLERFLIERCGLPDGRMLECERPQLIREIGKAFTGRAAAAKSVSPPLPIEQTVASIERATHPLAEKIRRRLDDDTIHDTRLAAMLERSCSRRMGYDGDDEVTHAGSR